MSQKKYRPYFTLDQLKLLSSLLKSQMMNGADISQKELSIYLEKYILEIEQEYRKPNHTNKPDILESLGFALTPKREEKDPRTLYLAWQANATLTTAEISIVQQYRYEHNLMTPEQERGYEKSQGLDLG